MPAKTGLVHVRVPEDVRDRFLVLLRKRKETQQSVLAKAVLQYLKPKEGK